MSRANLAMLEPRRIGMDGNGEELGGDGRGGESLSEPGHMNELLFLAAAGRTRCERRVWLPFLRGLVSCAVANNVPGIT